MLVRAARCRQAALVAERVRVHEIDDDEGRRLPLRSPLIRAGGRVRLGWRRSAHARAYGPAWCRRR
ncbi:hypothetical protein GSF24_21480 [Microbispora triticiradicis]|nr:hypothetical protein [Microbispora triticiradicis]